MQQITLLKDQMKEYEQNVQELEAAKEQLEEDSFSTQNSLQQMEKLHAQVYMYTRVNLVTMHFERLVMKGLSSVS